MSEEIKTELVTQDTPKSPALSMLEGAINSGLEPEKLLQFYEIHKLNEENEARKAFALSMALAQEEIPAVGKDSRNDQTNSWYSSIDNMIMKAKPVYTKHGFSLVFSEEEAKKEGWVRTVCEVIHKQGHIRKYYKELPLDNAGIKGSVNKTTIHAVGSTTSYGRRYITALIFNISTGDDNDGNRPQDHKSVTDIYNMKTKEHAESVNAIIEGIANNNLSSAVEAWAELKNEDRQILWLSHPKCKNHGVIPCFTLEERKVFKSEEWKELRTNYYEQANK